MVQQHLVERQKALRETFQQLRLLVLPLLQAMAAELAFLVPHEGPPFRFGHELLPVNIVEFETAAFHFAFNAAPEDALHAFTLAREQAELKFIIQILPDHLRVVVGFKHDGFAVFDDRHAVITALGQLPNQRALRVGDVDDVEFCAGVFQDAALHDAKRTPGKLNQLNHAARRE